MSDFITNVKCKQMCIIQRCKIFLQFHSILTKARTCIYSGLELGGYASPNANYFWGKCESLWPTDSQYFWVTSNQFKPIANHFRTWIRKRPFFEKFYTMRNNSVNKLRISANEFKK